MEKPKRAIEKIKNKHKDLHEDIAHKLVERKVLRDLGAIKNGVQTLDILGMLLFIFEVVKQGTEILL